MLRLLLRLLGIRDFDTCKSCETLTKQLAFANEEKRQLTETLLNILQPKVVESTPIEVAPLVNTGGIFSRRRAALEARDRADAQIVKEAKFVGKPDALKEVVKKEPITSKSEGMVIPGTIEALERELDIEGENQQNG